MGKFFKSPLFFALLGAGFVLAFPELVHAEVTTEAGGASTSTDNGCTAGTLGGMICNVINGTANFPGFIAGLCYMAGLFFGVSAIWKLKEHVESPNHNKIGDPLKRFAAGGAFFALPTVIEAVKNTIVGSSGEQSISTTGFQKGASGVGLDSMMVKFVDNIMAPTMWATGWVGWLAGMILVCIGISRLMKSEQDGPRGPTGIGTIMTFLVAGALLSLPSMVSYANNTIFGSGAVKTNGVLAYSEGLGGAAPHIQGVLGAIIAFSLVLGWISVARGIYMVRGVSEGNNQVSMMAAITHIVGGALAVNLGGVIGAVQSTLGISQYGITFSG